MRREIHTMNRKAFFHLCANGAEVRNFIICRADYEAAFNLIGVCAANSRAKVVSFSLEDTHPHILLFGTYEDCLAFKCLFEQLYLRYAASTREPSDKLVFHSELYPIGDDEDYLRNVAVYTVIQATKDGKPVMPYDYPWGTGSLYFRSGHYTPVWYFDPSGQIREPVPFRELGAREQRAVLHTRSYTIPGEWLVCNGLILPENYINKRIFEGIYQTCNRFRVFLSSPRKREEEMLARMSDYRGIALEDQEARRLCGDLCNQMYGFRDPRRLNGEQRLSLARELRHDYHLTFRQLALLVRLPESEIRFYVR